MQWLWLLALVALVVGGLYLRWLRGPRLSVAELQKRFRQQREHLEAEFPVAAAATGKPRGLRWKDCSFESDLHLARDRTSRELVALVPVTIQFEAVEGGDMEGVPAVAHAKTASAVFFFQRGQWLTTGKAIFNLNPAEALRRFHDRDDRLPARHSGFNAHEPDHETLAAGDRNVDEVGEAVAVGELCTDFGGKRHAPRWIGLLVRTVMRVGWAGRLAVIGLLPAEPEVMALGVNRRCAGEHQNQQRTY